MLYKVFSIIFGIIIISTGCQNVEKRSHGGGKRQVSKRPEQGFTPSSSGKEFEVLILNDSINKEKTLQKTIDSVFNKPYPALPQKERWFSTNYIKARNYNKIHRRHKSVLFLSIIPEDKMTNSLVSDELFSQKTLQEMANSREISIKTKWDVFAQPQLVMLITAPSRDKLKENIHKYQSEIVDWFDRQESRVFKEKVYSGGKNTILINEMKNTFGFHIKLPKQYDKEKFFEEPNKQLKKTGARSLAWYSMGTKETVQNVMAFTLPYEAGKLNKKGIKQIRNKVSKPLIRGSKDDTYMVIEDRYSDVPLQYETQSINDKKVHMLRGLWRFKNDYMGGPFVTYVMGDQSNDRLIVLDGFIFAAGEKKKPLMKRVETILKTFELKKPQ